MRTQLFVVSTMAMASLSSTVNAIDLQNQQQHEWYGAAQVSNQIDNETQNQFLGNILPKTPEELEDCVKKMEKELQCLQNFRDSVGGLANRGLGNGLELDLQDFRDSDCGLIKPRFAGGLFNMKDLKVKKLPK